MPLKKLNTQQENTNDGIVLINTDEATIVKASAIYKSMLNELVENYISENEDVYSNTMFYGGVPIDLEAESLLHIVQYNITEDKKRRQYLYNITSKLDGLRLLMFIHPLMESVMFIDRKPNFYEASLNENTREKYNIMQNFTSVTGLNKNEKEVSRLNKQKNYTVEENTEVPNFSIKQNYTIRQDVDFQILCDGEYYEETNEFFVFDLLYYNDRYICMYPFSTRLNELESFFEDKKIKQLLNDIFLQTDIHIILKPYTEYSTLIQQSVRDIPSYIQKEFDMYVSNMYTKKKQETDNELKILNDKFDVYKQKNETPHLPEHEFYLQKYDRLNKLSRLLQKRTERMFRYEFDGLIFTPTTTKYVLFDSWKYPMNILYKWKPQKDHTVDFFVNNKNQLMINRQNTRELFEYEWFGASCTPTFLAKVDNEHIKNKIVECDITSQYVLIAVIEMTKDQTPSTSVEISNALKNTPSYVYFYIRHHDRKAMVKNNNQFLAYTNKKIVLLYNNWNTSTNAFVSKCMLISIHRDANDVNVHTFVIITSNEKKGSVSEAYHVDKTIDSFNTNSSPVFYCYNAQTVAKNDMCDAYTFDDNGQANNVVFDSDGMLNCYLLNCTENDIHQNTLCKCVKIRLNLDFKERRIREDKEKANTLMGAYTTIRLHRLNIDINVIIPLLENDTNIFNVPIFPRWQIQTRFLQEQKYNVIMDTESLIHRFNRNRNMKNEFEVRFGHYKTQKQSTTHGVARKHYMWLMHTLNTYQIPYIHSYCIDVFENDNLRTSYFFQQEDQNEYKHQIRTLKKANYKHNIALHQTSKINIYKCIKKTQQDIKNIIKQEIDLEDTFGYSLRLSVAQEDDAICPAIKKGYDFHTHVLQSNVRVIRYKERYSYEFLRNWIIDLTHVTTKYGPSSESQKVYSSHEVEIEFKAYSKEDVINIKELNEVILFVLINLYGKSKIL